MLRNALAPARTPPRHRTTLPVLGVPVRLEADAAAILSAAEAAMAYPHFTAGPAGDVVPDGAESPVIRLVLGPPPAGGDRHLARPESRHLPDPEDRHLPDPEDRHLPDPEDRQLALAAGRHSALVRGHPSALARSREPSGGPRLHVRTDHRRRLVLRGGGVVAFANLRRLEATCALEPGILEDRELFGEVLDTLTLMLVNRLDRQPVHAAAVELNGRAAVLAGASGTGKSTIAYAALRAGLRVLDDDAVYVQLKPRFRLWGKGRRLHLTPEAARLFPELADRTPVLRPNGKWKIPVATSAGSVSTPPVAESACLCLLQRPRDPDTQPGDPAAGRRADQPGHPAALDRTDQRGRASLDGADPDNAVSLERIETDEAVARLLGGLEPGFSGFRGTIEPRLRALARGGVWRLRLSDDPNAAVACIRQFLMRPEP